ncbi:MAG: hypothetical protein IJZ56_04405 [Oscillospiraceae bacterium]|nr:hypothetical protein [Oscillospiraceae bacterium]
MKSKLATALLSIAIALAVWFYVVTVVSPNSDKNFHNIPVVTQGEALLQERGLMITGTDVTTTSLHLEGSRIDLNKLSSSNIVVTMDVSKIYEAGTHDLTYSVTYPGDVASNAITILSKNPGSVKVTVEERISKTVPVQIQYSGTVSENYMADKENAELDVENVTVTGPKTVIDKIAAARIDVDLEGRSESISDKFTYTLCDAKGEPVDAKTVVTDVADISLILRIVRVKEISLTVNVVDGGGATSQTSLIAIDPPTIRVSGSDTLLEGLNSLELDTINLADISEDSSFTYVIKLPEGVNNETGVNEATVSVSFPDLATRMLTVKNIKAVNVPAGFSVDVITKALEIQIRGPKAKIDGLNEENITVTVDFAAAEEGTVKLKVTVNCGDPEIGAVGSYTVSATVRKTTG